MIEFLKQFPFAKSIIKWHFDFNSAIDAPYHNLFHNLTVSKYCYEIANTKQKLDMNSLICAALFHDFDHTQGKKKDNVNISKALDTFDSWCSGYSEKDINKDTVIACIKATEFPYVIPNDELTIEQQIIRDADMCQMFESNRIQQIYIGLMKEININGTFDRGNVIKFLDSQQNFINNIKPNTEYLKILLIKEKQKIFDEIDYLITCLI